MLTPEKFFKWQSIDLRTVDHLTMDEAHSLQIYKHHTVVKLIEGDQIISSELLLSDEDIGNVSESIFTRRIIAQLAVLAHPAVYIILGQIYRTR